MAKTMKAAILTLGLVLAALAGGRAQVATLRVAVIPFDNAAQVYYAKDLGYFAKAGLDVEIQPNQSGSAIAAAVASNAVDIGYSGVVAIAAAHNKNIPVVAIAPAAMYESAAPNFALVVARNSPIKTAKDLNGKTIAANGLSTITEYGPRAWIDKNGGDSSTVKFVELGFSAMPDAVASGRVDAACIGEPFLAIGKQTGRVLAYANDTLGKDFLVAAWFTTSQWAQSHPDLVKRFAGVMRETALWANRPQNQAKSAEILVKYTKIDPAIVASMVRARYGDRLTAASMQSTVDVSAKYGKFEPFPAQDLIYAR